MTQQRSDEVGYHRILVATDFSPHAEAALKQAVWLTRRTGASLVLAHTVPDLQRAVHSASYKARLALLYGEDDLFQREICQESETKMRRSIVNLKATDLNIKFETLLGEPFVEITHAVQQEGYDLVLAGTRGLASWEQFFVGSTSRRLIRKCPASVWIAKEEHVGPPKVVLAATDFSDVSFKAAKQALWIAELADAKFHLVHVVDSMDVPEEVISKFPEGDSLRNDINAEAQDRLESFVQSLASNRSKIHLHLAWGTPWKDIRRIARELHADLIALGTVGRSGIKGLLLGNTAEKMLSTCDCSILTVKPDGFVSPITPEWSPLRPGPDERSAAEHRPEN
jgi:nucleotide-binding universal stress UspA family protein